MAAGVCQAIACYSSQLTAIGTARTLRSETITDTALSLVFHLEINIHAWIDLLVSKMARSPKSTSPGIGNRGLYASTFHNHFGGS